MKNTLLLFLATIYFNTSICQSLKPKDAKNILNSEDSMKHVVSTILKGITFEDRRKSDSIFTKLLVRSLKTSYSYNYRFSTLDNISILYPPDSSFRIFTWQLMVDDNQFVHRGAIQMKTADGSLQLIPLFDKSNSFENPEDSVCSNSNWIGAIYYNIVQKKYNNKNYYSLLGFDEHGLATNRKIIDVLYFENNKAIFGGDFFVTPSEGPNPNKRNRIVIEYKKNAAPRLNYDSDMNMIIKEHLISENNMPNDKSTLIGDGDYEGFFWKDGKWIFISKVFYNITPQGINPAASPAKDEKVKIKN